MPRAKKEPTTAPRKKRSVQPKDTVSEIASEEHNPILIVEEQPISVEKKFPIQSSVRRRIFLISSLIVLLTIGVVGYFLFSQTPEERAEKEMNTLLADVASLMILPQSEMPLIYTIDDPELLRLQQPFFTDALAGDKLLVYPVAVKAVIYSPERNLIVNVGTIATDRDIQQEANTLPVSSELDAEISIESIIDGE